MNAEDIIKALRLCGETSECVVERIDCPYCENTDSCSDELLFDAADLIESLQEELANLNTIMAAEGFSNLATMIAKYKTVMLAANETSIEQDERIEQLESLLAEYRRRERAARLEVCRRCPDGEIVDGVKHYPCDGCKWRGPEAEEGVKE